MHCNGMMGLEMRIKMKFKKKLTNDIYNIAYIFF